MRVRKRYAEGARTHYHFRLSVGRFNRRQLALLFISLTIDSL